MKKLEANEWLCLMCRMDANNRKDTFMIAKYN